MRNRFYVREYWQPDQNIISLFRAHHGIPVANTSPELCPPKDHPPGGQVPGSN